MLPGVVVNDRLGADRIDGLVYVRVPPLADDQLPPERVTLPVEPIPREPVKALPPVVPRVTLGCAVADRGTAPTVPPLPAVAPPTEPPPYRPYRDPVAVRLPTVPAAPAVFVRAFIAAVRPAAPLTLAVLARLRVPVLPFIVLATLFAPNNLAPGLSKRGMACPAANGLAVPTARPRPLPRLPFAVRVMFALAWLVLREARPTLFPSRPPLIPPRPTP